MEKKKIMIVEDEQDVADVLIQRLSSAGHSTLSAPDAAMALAMIHQQKPDLVLLDLMLPAGGGLHVLRMMKLSTHTKQIPVVVLTGSGETAYKAIAEELGVNAYFYKPYDFEELSGTIRDLIERN